MSAQGAAATLAAAARCCSHSIRLLAYRPPTDRTHDPLLVSNIIEQITWVDIGPRVSVRNSSEAHYATDAKGRRWVRKSATEITEGGLLAEALYLLLAKELEVPTADGAVHCGSDLAWLSLVIRPVTHWDPHLAPTVKNLPEIGRIVALDGIVGCWDRHPGNLLLQVTDDVTQHAWAIDADHSVIRDPRALAALGTGIAHETMGPRGLPMEQIAGEARATAARAANLEASALSAYVREACTIAGEQNVNLLHDALLERCRRAPGITERYLDLIGSLK